MTRTWVKKNFKSTKYAPSVELVRSCEGKQFVLLTAFPRVGGFITIQAEPVYNDRLILFCVSNEQFKKFNLACLEMMELLKDIRLT